jgi:hypothetical protein
MPWLLQVYCGWTLGHRLARDGPVRAPSKEAVAAASLSPYLEFVVARAVRTGFRPLLALFVTGLWVAFSGWAPSHRVAEDRERACHSACHEAIADDQRKRSSGESTGAPQDDAAGSPPRVAVPILLSSQSVTLLAEGTDAVRSAVLRSTRARGPPASRT